MNGTRTQKTSAPRRRGRVISIRDARARRVQALKALVRSGRYAPPLEQVADALIARGVITTEQVVERHLAAEVAELPN